MSSEQLRRTIVRAITPLISEYDTLTMDRIARAAGISEADLVTVFADKDAVLQAWYATLTARIIATLDPAEEVRRMDAIRVDQPVAARLLAVIDILGAYHERVRADLEAVQNGVFAGGEPGTRSTGRDDFRGLGNQPEIEQAVARLLRPDEQHLRLPAETLAEIFLIMSRVCTRASNERQPLPAEQVVDLFLHGALITG
jgi:AcrR family transcriptional regulator